MSEPYLVAHKCRGERDFAIAEQVDINGEAGWIISSTGHRCYPFWTYRLNLLFAYMNVGDPPESLRDFWAASQPSTARAARQERAAVPLEELA